MLAHKVSFYLCFFFFAEKVWLTVSLKRKTCKEKFSKLVSYLGYIWSFVERNRILPFAPHSFEYTDYQAFLTENYAFVFFTANY